MNRQTALQTVERHAWGGNYYDSFSHAAMFRRYQPYNFGVRTSQLFSSEIGSHLVNKRFTYMTIAKKNVYMLPGGTDDYSWHLMADADVDFRMTEFLGASTDTPGKGGLPFLIALDRDWLRPGTVIKLENSDLPLLYVRSEPTQRSSNSWQYEVSVQTGDPNSYIPVDYLQPGKRAIRVSTLVADELNEKYGSDQYGEMFKLQSWCSNYANKAEFTDKFIRTEIACRKEGRPMPQGMKYTAGGMAYNDGAVSSGYVYQQKFTSNDKNVYEAGVFITKIEARLLERTEMDREMAMEFGQLQKTKDAESGRVIKAAAGWRQLRKEGHYKEHNGSLTLDDIYEYLSTIFLTRKGFADREIMIASGEGGIAYLSRLIAREAAQFQTIDTHFIEDRKDPQGYNQKELTYGAQFTKIRMTNGIVVSIMYDPIKDDRKLFPELAPGTNRTLESFTMDIFDFGSSNQKALDASGNNNITMVMQDGVESYFTVSNVYNFETGAITDGSNAYAHSKELGIYREMSGSVCIWDISRVGSIVYVPTV